MFEASRVTRTDQCSVGGPCAPAVLGVPGLGWAPSRSLSRPQDQGIASPFALEVN